jgi:hypothetical protein
MKEIETIQNRIIQIEKIMKNKNVALFNLKSEDEFLQHVAYVKLKLKHQTYLPYYFDEILKEMDE